MPKIRNRNKSITSNVLWKFAERIIAQGVSFIVSLVLARLLMPEDYGAVSIILIFIEIANVLLTSGLSTALIQKKEISELETSTIFYCNLALSLLLYMLLFVASPWIAQMYELPILQPAIRIFALRLPIAAFQAIQTAIVSRQMDFKKFFFCTIGGTLASAVVGIIMAVQGYGVWALVAQYLVNTVIDTLILALFVRWKPRLQFSYSAAKPLIQYGWKVMVTDLIGTIFNQISGFIVGLRYTTADLAYYTKGKQLPQLARNNIYSTLLSVLFPAMSRVNDDMEQVKAVSRRSIRMLCYIICPMMVGLMAVSEELVMVLYTEKWIQMTPFVAIVCLECIISIPPTITLQSIKAAGRSDIMLKLEFIKKPLLLISILAAMPFGVLAVALTLPLNTLIDFILNSIYSKKILNYSIGEQLFDCLPNFALSAVMGICVWLLGRLSINTLLLLVIQCVCGLLLYIGLSILTRNREFRDLWQMIRTRFLHKKA